MGDSTEQSINLDDEIVSAEAKREALEKLSGLKKTLEYYGKNKSLYINMNGPQKVLNKQEIIEHFRKSPVLFHNTGDSDDKKTLLSIATHGLTTIDFRSSNENLFATPKLPIIEAEPPETPYTEDDMWADLLDQEYQMDNAWNSARTEYNRRYISLTFIPWWNVRRIDEDKPVSKLSHTVNKEGKVELGVISIAIDETESKKIIDRNCDELEKSQPDSEFSQLVNDRTVAFAEALEPLQISPRHIAGLFLMERKIDEIDNANERTRFRLEVNYLGIKFKTPIFNYYGDLLWPKELDNQDVLDLISGKNNKSD
jgi:hypothetical protein